jgi:hypothetical protein
MDWLFSGVIAAAAIVYICFPLWAGASQVRRGARHETWHSVEQLEIDRELGKIDDAEYEELKPRLPVRTALPPLEALIYGARQQKRAQTAIETEILIARARKKNT